MPTQPTDVMVANGWYIDGMGESPHFHTLSGLSRSTGEVTFVDGGSNVTHKFISQIVDYGTITLTRALDNTAADDVISSLAQAGIINGARLSASLVKKHHGAEVFRIAFNGVVTEESWSDFNTESEDKMDISLTIALDNWEKA